MIALRPAPEIVVVGVDTEGSEVARLALGHGDDPTALLAVHGWGVRQVREVTRYPFDRHVLTLTFLVEPRPFLSDPASVPAPSTPFDPSDPSDPSTPPASSTPFPHPAVAVDPSAVRVQRVAAHAVVTSSRGLLMTQFSDLTGAPGQWGLPGGGLEADEAPERAVLREVWEESGQLVEVSELALVQTRHWVGRAPAGRLEDFHAVRIVYRAFCLEPTDPVVHDVGGTTESAAWMQPADLDLLAVTPGWRSVLSEVVTAPDQADGPEQHHHDADADDRDRAHP